MSRKDRSGRRGVLAATFFMGVTGAAFAASCGESAPDGLRRTPDGPGATVRFDLAHTPLPEVPLPNDTATWADPTSRTGLRINASLVAPTEIEQNARMQFDQLEGWGTFSPVSVSFDLPEKAGRARLPTEAALDLENIKRRHKDDDYEFADDAFYLVNLKTGVPIALDVGNGNFNYTLKKLDKYWPNDTRASERNLLFDTIDETRHGAIDRTTFAPGLDTDFDGNLDVPNLDDAFACPDPDLLVCDNPEHEAYAEETCVAKRRLRDQCIADHFLTYYERETDTLIMRPLIPMDEMTRYAVVITDRLVDANGDAVKSPFEFIYHAAQESTAARVRDVINKKEVAAYYGDIAGTGLDHVAFTWGFTTQPTVDDMKRLRDGLYGQGPFKKFAKDFPIRLSVERAVGLTAGLKTGTTESPGWQTSSQGEAAGCPEKADNLFIIKAEDLHAILGQLIVEGFGERDGPATQELLRTFDAVDYLMVGTFKSPFLLEGGPKSTDPKASFHLNYLTGEGEVTEDTVQFFVVVPKETSQFKQPFDVNIYGHGYTGAFIEEIIYAGDMAKHGLATVGINAMGHGLDFGDAATDLIVKGVLSSACVAPFYDALQGRARDLNRDGRVDSGGDFWSSYLFHTRDGVRQSVLDHIQLVRILRAFGTTEGEALCQNEQTGWASPATEKCDVDADGSADTFGDFDGNGVADFGGPDAHYGTWGESLGGILSGIHGAIDAYVTAASPGSGGGGLTDIGIRSFQGGVVEAVLLRIWGPLIVTVPSESRKPCDSASKDSDRCTVCAPGEISLRWVMPDLNDTGELEIKCLAKSEVQNTTVLVYNASNAELRCARVDDKFQMRVGIPASIGDRIDVSFYDLVDKVEDYESCKPTFAKGEKPRTEVASYGRGRVVEGTTNAVGTASCEAATCNSFQGLFYGEGNALTAPAEGFGQIRQTPSLRRFIQLAQAALEPGDPISFAPYYSIKPMTDPNGDEIAPHAVITLNTIGDMNVPLNSGIAFARATGAVPFMRPDQAARYPEYAPYMTPPSLFEELGGETPNRHLIGDHVVEGITKLARHPAGPECEASANAQPLNGTWLTGAGEVKQCFPTGCTEDTEKTDKTRVCYSESHCDFASGECRPNALGKEACEEALFDADDLDEGKQLYFEQAAQRPLRLVRYTERATIDNLEHVWEPRIKGQPFGEDLAWTPNGTPVTGLLDAYIVPGGVHTFTNGNPCEGFDAGTYLTNLVGRFFMTDGEDVYYLSHPQTHHCLAKGPETCDYLDGQ